jgi:hypothetical protein
MSDRDDLERRLESWLADTAQPMPPDLRDDIVASAPRVPRAGIRAEFPSGRRWQAAMAGLAAVLALAVGLGVALRGPIGPGASATPSAASATPTAASSLGPTASAVATGLGEWHRNNYNAGRERLTCREGAPSWTCTYEIPDGTGSFVGQAVAGSWTCPEWFPSAICDNVTTVYRGVFVCCLPAEGQPSAATPNTVSQEYVITKVAGREVLQLYWVDQFVCPWYRTVDEALAADYKCVFPPGSSHAP